MQTRFDIRGLIEALRHSDAAIRRRAVVALRAIGAVDAIAALRQALDQEQDPDTRTALVAALATLESDQAPQAHEEAPTLAPAPMPEPIPLIHVYIEQLKDKSPERVIDAVRKLGEMKNKQAAEALVLVFNDRARPTDLRLEAAEALLKLDSAPVEVALLGALRSPNWRFRRNGAAILGQLKASWAVKPLSVALKDSHEIVRRTAYAALKVIDTPEARQALGVTRPSRPKESDTKRLRAASTPLNREPKQGPMPDTPTKPLDRASDSTRAGSSDETKVRPPRGEKFEWPKRTTLEANQRAKTADLNPKRLEEAQDRLNAEKSPDADKDLSKGE